MNQDEARKTFVPSRQVDACFVELFIFVHGCNLLLQSN